MNTVAKIPFKNGEDDFLVKYDETHGNYILYRWAHRNNNWEIDRVGRFGQKNRAVAFAKKIHTQELRYADLYDEYLRGERGNAPMPPHTPGNFYALENGRKMR